MRYLRLLGVFLKSNLLLELEYRANFLTQSLLGVFWASISFAGISIFYTQTDQIGGWSYGQALLIVALFTFLDGLLNFLMRPNTERIVTMVREGTMDFVLTKPANSQFLATLRHMRYAGLSDMLAGAAIFAFAGTQLALAPRWEHVLQFAVMLISAVLLIYSIWVAMASLSFWFVRIENIAELFSVFFETARFPISTFGGLLRFILTFVVPIAFMTTFPAQAVLGMLEPHWLLSAPLVAAAMLWLTHRLWRFAVLHYSSASS